jgi:hydroxyacylglutathione hydrolase
MIHPKIVQITTPFRTTRVELFLLKGEKNIIIDTGTERSPQQDILPVLESLGLTFRDIDLVLNTHGHDDHIGGNAYIKAASGGQLFIHRDDVVLLNNRELYFEQQLAPVIKAQGGNLQEERAIALNIRPVTPDKQLVDKDIIKGGNGMDLQVVHLPGHTNGSVGFLWEQKQIMFCGDSLVGLHEGNGKLPIIFDLEAYIKSVEKLQGMQIRTLFCAHSYRGINLPPNAVRRGAEVSQYLRDCREFACKFDESVRKALSSASKMSFEYLADKIIAQLPDEMGFAPITKVAKRWHSAQVIFFHLCRLDPSWYLCS